MVSAIKSPSSLAGDSSFKSSLSPTRLGEPSLDLANQIGLPSAKKYRSLWLPMNHLN